LRIFLVKKIHISLKSATLLEDLFAFFIISCSLLLRMRNVVGKLCREK